MLHFVSVKVEDASEVDQHKQVIPGWSQEYTQMSPGAFRGRTVYVQMDGLEVFEEHMNLRVEQEFHSPVDSLVFSFDMNESTLYLLNETTRNTWVTPENYRELSVVIKRSDLALGDNLFEIDHLVLRPLHSRYCSLFAKWMSSALGQVASDPSRIELQNLRAQILEDCSFILEQGLEVGPRDNVKAAQAKEIIQRVIERVNDSPQDNVPVVELADAAGVSIRRLQHVFREYSGMSPMQWLRVRRLNSVRRDLMRSCAHETTVCEVAMRWSFWHLGRFSESYRSLFGEHPRVTLNRTAV
ncbi:helix-turn-helix domain-containing protein [Pseudomonas mediterranea]|uniref:helix-turn-helix domain-containing protein n=1 Tax=Pseudomonas mediterranea TaxID=183795 RepID=UPI0013173CEC|nr:helix-turn-helix domain-containing protein [Pseudomonas mediterranea]QHA82028.1 helix-turn-helix domain-containing protein [Pseudomonas mediterranea]